MADFCKQCSYEAFGIDAEDFKDVCGDGEQATVVCEGCGPTEVDCNGKCVSDTCTKQHGLQPDIEGQ